MFTGIIEGLGSIVGIRPSGLGRRLTVDTDFDLGDTKIGDSLSVSGACLTVVIVEARRFQADVSRPDGEGGTEGGDEMDRFSAEEAGSGGAMEASEDALVELLRSALSHAFERCDPGSVLILQLVGVHGVNQQAVAVAPIPALARF